MKKTNIAVDFENNALVISKAFYKKACAFGSKENVALREAMEAYKGFSIEFKFSDKKTYNGLSFKRMAEYIQTQPEAEMRMLEFEAVKRVAKAKGALYPLTKEWFFQTYPQYKEDEVSENEMVKALIDEKAKAAEEAEKKMNALLLGPLTTESTLPQVA